LQKADAARTGEAQRDEDIARALHTSLSTVYRVRKRFVEHGLNAALYPNQRSQRPRMRVGGRHCHSFRENVTHAGTDCGYYVPAKSEDAAPG
jgi:hypothetical protein